MHFVLPTNRLLFFTNNSLGFLNEIFRLNPVMFIPLHSSPKVNFYKILNYEHGSAVPILKHNYKLHLHQEQTHHLASCNSLVLLLEEPLIPSRFHPTSKLQNETKHFQLSQLTLSHSSNCETIIVNAKLFLFFFKKNKNKKPKSRFASQKIREKNPISQLKSNS